MISFPVASELYSFLQPEERYRSYHTDATGFDMRYILGDKPQQKILSRSPLTSQGCFILGRGRAKSAGPKSPKCLFDGW
jgi:hypothetical protein